MRKRNNNDSHITKPVIKWVGGKSQIIDALLERFPKRINNYHEIFLGGSSVLVGLLCMIKQKRISVHGKICAYDINETLIHLFKNIQRDHNEIYGHTQKLLQTYNKCPVQKYTDNNVDSKKPLSLQEALLSQESYYYWIRKCFNRLNNEEKKTSYGSALFLFLNKTCFRGLYRVSSSNSFNVSFGHYRNPEIINKTHLDEIHELLQPVEFYVCDFRSSLQNAFEDDDFVYIDPPYASIPEQSQSFVGYSKDGFKNQEHDTLFNLCHDLSQKNVKLMMSNADVPIIQDAFDSPNYHIETISCKRQINSKKPGSKINEVIITNY